MAHGKGCDEVTGAPTGSMLVVIATLEEIDTIFPHQVDDPMFGGEAAAPYVGPQVLQRLGLTDSGEGIPHDGFHDLERPSRGFRIGLDPPGEIVAELIVEDGDPPCLSAGPPRRPRDPAPPAVPRQSAPCPFGRSRAGGPSADARRSSVSARDARSRPGSPARRPGRARRPRRRDD